MFLKKKHNSESALYSCVPLYFININCPIIIKTKQRKTYPCTAHSLYIEHFTLISLTLISALPNIDALDDLKDLLNIDLPGADVFRELQETLLNLPGMSELQTYKEIIPEECLETLKSLATDIDNPDALIKVSDKCAIILEIN